MNSVFGITTQDVGSYVTLGNLGKKKFTSVVQHSPFCKKKKTYIKTI